MGKSFRRDSSHKPKVHGRIFDKDNQSWKKKKKREFPISELPRDQNIPEINR